MHRKITAFFISISSSLLCNAQQFPGASGMYQPGVSFITQNPAWATTANNGTEIHLFSASALAGTNAYSFSKDWFNDGFAAGANEGEEYNKNYRTRKNRHLWGNIDVLGPAVAFSVGKDQTIAVFTRMRQIARGGNINGKAMQLIGGIDPLQKFPDTFQFDKAGFSTHVFGEVGFTYARVLSNDYYHIWKAGATIKYLMGMSAGSVFTPSTTLIMQSADSVASIDGTVTALYSTNAAPYVNNDFNDDISSWFDKAGGGSIGFDIGVQYEFHPDASPNKETPYAFRIDAAITDIGSIPYKSDTMGGVYSLKAQQKFYYQLNRNNGETFDSYINHLKTDSIAFRQDSTADFRMGLPTAFRLNADVNLSANFWLGANLLLNMRGDNGDIYRPAYTNMLNLTPRFENEWLMIGIPFTFLRYGTLATGVSLRVGPLFLGSASIISTLIDKEIKNADVYAGLSFKLNKKKNGNYY